MSEVRTLLLTDVVDSTRLAQELGDRRMAEVWSQHDRVARDLLRVWRGREIDKTDGMLLLFDGVADAVGYALAYHQALAGLSLPLSARAGIHHGPVLLRENSAEDIAAGAKPLEVEGLAKPTAARVMALAHGDQLLLTPPARAALAAALPEGLDDLVLSSRGHWLMKGLSEPLEVFEASRGPSRRPEPQDSDKAVRMVRSGERWLPARDIPNNLPHPVTRFVGREREIDALKSRLDGPSRLITVLGMGGLGKTRLALQLAEEIKHRFADGVWFLDLSALRDAAAVAAQAAQVFEVRDEPGRSLVQTLCVALRTRRMLLVVDNCEHLLEPAGDLIDELLRAVPQLRVLASSRAPLDLPGEQSYLIQPLPLPSGADPATLQQSPAVRLFVDRAQAHRPDFAVDADNAPALASLVARLEGIPLAIELAAARLRTLDVDEIDAGLAQRFQLLNNGSRRMQARHQTLRSLVDWSYALLDAAEQTLLQRLSAFAGGFDAQAVPHVCAAAPLDGHDVPALLASLADKSLVVHDGQGGGRWRMLETIREYAADKLQQSGDAPATAARHAEHFFGRAKLGRDGLKGPEQPVWIGRLEADLDNLRTALATALSGGVDPFIAVKMAVALQGFWVLRGYVAEGRAAVQAALALPAVQASDLAQSHALYVGAVLAGYQGDAGTARDMLQSCLALRRRSAPPVEVAAALSSLAIALRRSGDLDTAIAHEREALDIFRSIDDRIGQAIGWQHLGECAMDQGQAEPARASLAQALALARQIGHREVETECERMLGELDTWQGQWALARARFERACEVACASADRRNEAQARRWLGRADLHDGALDSAGRSLGQALQAFHDADMRDELLAALEDHAELALALGLPAQALRLAAAAERARERWGGLRPAHEHARWQAWLLALQDRLPAEQAAAARLEAWRWDRAEAVRAALALAPGARAAHPPSAA